MFIRIRLSVHDRDLSDSGLNKVGLSPSPVHKPRGK